MLVKMVSIIRSVDWNHFDLNDYLYFVYVNVFPDKPAITVRTGLNKQKNANGTYAIVGTPRTLAINTPQTLHGTSGLMTVPASSATRAKLIVSSPTFLYCAA